MRVKIGTKLGRYTVLSKLGEGAFGTVWEASVEDTDERVALKAAHVTITRAKEIRDTVDSAALNAEVDTRMWMEDHPHILPLIAEPGDDAPKRHTSVKHRCCYVVMPIAGKSLAEQVHDHGGPLPRAFVQSVFVQIAGVLRDMHARPFAEPLGPGIMHRDVKPANILSSTHDSGHVYLADMGTVSLLGGFFPPPSGVGSPAYMSIPSTKEEDGGARDDLASLLYTMAFCLNGSLPWADAAKAKCREDVLRMKQATSWKELFHGDGDGDGFSAALVHAGEIVDAMALKDVVPWDEIIARASATTATAPARA